VSGKAPEDFYTCEHAEYNGEETVCNNAAYIPNRGKCWREDCGDTDDVKECPGFAVRRDDPNRRRFEGWVEYGA
jgi:hypothetical protein